MKLLLLAIVAVAAGAALAPPGRRSSLVPAQRLRQLLSSLPLELRETRLGGIWQQASLDGERIAFQVDDDTLILFVGDFEPHSKLSGGCFLGRASPARSGRGSAGGPLGKSFLDSATPELVSRYFPWSEAACNHRALANPIVREALLQLSPAVVNVGFHEPHGLQIELQLEQVTPQTLLADARRAVTLARALRTADLPDVDHRRTRSAG